MLAAWIYSVGLLVLGFVLILLEIFVIPGINILGVVGVVTVFGGVTYAYLTLGFWPAAGIAGLGLVGTIGLIGTVVHTRAWSRLVLRSATSRDQGYASSDPGLEALVGQQGEALCDLRPSGRARIQAHTVDVVSEGGYVQRGTRVEVLRVEGSRVVVQAVSGAAGGHHR